MTNSPTWTELWNLVRRIPAGQVMTYGQIADHLASEDVAALTARQVGRAMGESPEDVPWHRVVNASGRCSVDTEDNPRQQRLLEGEGVVFRSGKLRLVDFRWIPKPSPS
ncbi:MAG: MGMT family protein [Polyangiales bacterium]